MFSKREGGRERKEKQETGNETGMRLGMRLESKARVGTCTLHYTYLFLHQTTKELFIWSTEKRRKDGGVVSNVVSY